MYAIIKGFPKQLQEGIQLTTTNNLEFIQSADFHHIVIAGMGSSPLAGTLVKQWLGDILPIPLVVNHDYTLPGYVNEHTLLIVMSYSGSTEETLAVLRVGIHKGAKIVVISSGGKLKTIANEQEIPLLLLPTTLPPRAALAYNLAYLLSILSLYHPLPWDFRAEFLIAAATLQEQQQALQKTALQVATKIKGYLPVIYTTARYEGVALRLRQQLNENSKQLCWHHVIPELNHNEVVGWEKTHHPIAVVLLTGPNLDKRLQLQQDMLQQILQSCTNNFTLLEAQGPTLLIQSLYLIHLSDWISFYLAQQKAVDPTTVQFIEEIKAALNKTAE